MEIVMYKKIEKSSIEEWKKSFRDSENDFNEIGDEKSIYEVLDLDNNGNVIDIGSYIGIELKNGKFVVSNIEVGGVSLKFRNKEFDNEFEMLKFIMFK